MTWKDPEKTKVYMREYMREYLKKKRLDPEFIKSQRLRDKKRYADPEFRKKKLAYFKKYRERKKREKE